jgi:prepilin-type N-terminal cleavage/methylation domain-containing protein
MVDIKRKSKQRRQSGFTIVEIITVIIVIGILTSIVIVIYPGYQKRARDSERKSDVSQIATALGAYAIQKGHYIENNASIDPINLCSSGLNGSGNGWLNAGAAESSGASEGLGSYTKSIISCLEDAGVLRSGDFIDPLGCKYASGGQCGAVNVQTSPAQAYMKATCKKSGNAITYVLAHLENDPRKDSEVDQLCDANTLTGFTSVNQNWGTRYGMNYYVVAK